MKGKRKIIIWLFALVLVMVAATFYPAKESKYQGAISYTNAKMFYDSTGPNSGGTGKHMKVHNGTIYFATKAKLAHTYAVDYHTYYAYKGFDVTLSGGGATVSFAVKNGNTLKGVPGTHVEEGGYSYHLFCISRDDLEKLAKSIDPVNAEKVFGAERFQVHMDAIIVRIYAGMSGAIEEDGKGGIISYSPNNNYTWVWRLKDPKQLAEADGLYSGVKTFESLTDIRDYLDNYKLDVYYAVDGLPEVSASSSTHVTVESGYDLKDGDIDKDGTKEKYILFEGTKPKVQSSRLANTMTILNPLTAGPKISKTGYHLDDEVEGKEWITLKGKTFAAGESYSTIDLEPASGSGNASLCLYANWKPNTYTFEYFANGGSGSMTASRHTYDKESTLTRNRFSREGYTFAGWSITENGEVKYTDGQEVLNETSENGKNIKLYAVWEKNCYEITLDDDGANIAGSGVVYEGYGKGFYFDSNCNTAIDKVKKPEKTGYTFGGYYDAKNGGGMKHIDETGKITAENTAFKQERTIYANWNANTYTIRYHLGVDGASLADSPATYDKEVTLRPNIYTKRGYAFKGWARTEGGPMVYTDKQTVKNLTAENTVIDLYAVWEPVTALITLDPQEGSGGTEYFYEKFGVNFYSNSIFTEILDKISIPLRTGYDFSGYFADVIGSGNALIGSNGIFGINSTYFVQDSTLFAKWNVKTYTLTLNKEGGTGGTNSVIVTYDKRVPSAESVPPVEAPKRKGFDFKGYYTGKNGTGTKFYDEFMYCDIVYKSTQNTLLYAYWIDNYAPEVSLNGNDKWTNQKTTLTAFASDFGVGLKSLTIYRIADNGTLTAVATANNLNGAQTKELTFENTTQGVTRYKAVAVDLNGYTSESYSTVYYDTTKPTGSLVQFTQSGNQFTVIVDVTDANASN